MTGAIVVGTGFGARVHVPALRAAGFDVVGMVGRDAERTARRAARAGVDRVVTSLGDALAVDAVELVSIAVPPAAHAPLVLEACSAGRHVICEKPFALDSREAEQMVAAAEDAGVAAFVGHEFRWSPERALAARAITEGAIGEPQLASLVQFVPLVADPAARVPDWWFDAATGGGWLGASGSHVVDQVRTWLGEIATVNAALPTVGPHHGAEDSFVVRLTTRAGAEVVLQQTAASWTPVVVGLSVVAGTRGTLEIDGSRVLVSDRDGRRELGLPDDLALPVPPAISDDPRHRYTHLELGPYTRFCEAVRAVVEQRTPATRVPVPTFGDGLACMRVLDAVRQSAARAGALVEVAR